MLASLHMGQMHIGTEWTGAGRATLSGCAPGAVALAQIISTRDVKESLFNNWISGGLNRQIEHHLFPTLPRHSLKECTKLVEALCAKHGLVYEDVDWTTGTGLVLRHLAKVAATA